ncbi:MAG: thioredoxin family protein [Bacillota bacterium]
MAEVTHIRVDGALVGIWNLKFRMAEVKARPLPDNRARARLLLELVKEENYVPPRSEPAYEEALLQAYLVWDGLVQPEPETGIKILGLGCPRCRQLADLVREVLGELDLPCDVEHVTAESRIRSYGVIGSPALVINGRVVTAGQVPSRAELRELVQSHLF